MALAAMALCGAPAMAQTAAETDNMQNNKMYQPQRFTDFAFEGVLLSLPQQTRIDSLNAATKAAYPQFNLLKGEKPDSAAHHRADWGKMERRGPRGERPMMFTPGLTQDYVLKVKEILDPEQYATFLENIVLNSIPKVGAATTQQVKVGKDKKAVKDKDKAIDRAKAERAVKKAQKEMKQQKK